MSFGTIKNYLLQFSVVLTDQENQSENLVDQPIQSRQQSLRADNVSGIQQSISIKQILVKFSKKALHYVHIKL